MSLDSSHEADTIPPALDPEIGVGVQEPPRTLLGTLKQLGPGLIIAGSIVGSGELIATTKTGAQAGISLLWLIIAGCVIKVFVQIELGRHAITHGETTLAALNTVPGRIGRANWIIWFWIAMMCAGVAQLGGIVGGVGQAMAIAFPLTGDYREAIRAPSSAEIKQFLKWDDTLLSEWDLRVYQRSRDGDDTSSDELAERIGVDLAGWRADSVAHTQARLDAIEQQETGRAAAILASFDALSAAQQAIGGAAAVESDVAVNSARSELQQLLAQANEPFFLQRIEEIEQNENRSVGPLERNRIRRGNAVLAASLSKFDDFDRSGSVVVAAQVAANDSVARSAEIDAEFQSIAGSESNVSALRAAQQVSAVAKTRAAADSAVVSALLDPPTRDDKYWAAFATLITIALLYNGKYGLLQTISTVLVVGFTFITIGNVVALQNTQRWHVSIDEILRGLSFGLPQAAGGLTTALATFGIIGVGATELISYPYWCIEKGYAKHSGKRTDDDAWAQRARGWMRVMHYDAFLSMIVYTLATIAFYFMGVAVLFREGRDPDGMRMISTLASAYVPVFGEYAKWLFLVGAVAVLYSTFLVANAGHTRTITDVFKVLGLMDKHNQRTHDRSISTLAILLPATCLTVFCSGANPVQLVLISGMMQATMLPMIGIGALYFRYTATDKRIAPKRWWDVLLILSCIGLLITGVWGIVSKLI